MSKVRIYELAKETGLPNKEVIRRLSDLGVEAKSHSSTVEEPDAKRFRESLGKQREARRRERVERERREADEYDLSSIPSPAAEAKARRILPPHLRKQAEGADGAAASAPSQPGEQEGPPQGAPPRRFRPAATPFRPGPGGGVSVGGDDEADLQPAPQHEPARPDAPAPGPSSAPEEPAAEQQPAAPERPAASEQPAAETTPQPEDPSGPRPSAVEAARSGVVRPAQRPAPPRPPETPAREAEEPRGVPGVPRPGTPPRPGQPTVRAQPSSPTSTGAPVEPRRRLDHNLPREGSGRRSIPPPLRPAPKGQLVTGTVTSAPTRGRPAPGGAPSARPRRPGGPGGTQGPGQPGQPAAPGGAPGAPARPKKGKKGKRKKEPTLQEQFEAEQHPRQRRSGPVKPVVSGPVDVVPGVTVGEFAKLIGVSPTDIVRVLFGMGEMITVTQSMSNDLVELVASELEADVRFVTPEEQEFGAEVADDPEDMEPRAPVVTVMGHVDHGKTLLLDAVRQTDVVSGEAGGITQHIGAYQVTKDGRAVTFIDTPGHEAFTQMRARGAGVTDVAILVVAADDGVKPQTVEAINHIRAAEVPIIVAVNKIDREGADPVRVRTQLTEHGLVAEEFGGDTTMVDVSALTRHNLDELLEMVLLQADVSELAANPKRPAQGAVIEAHLDRGRGAVATVLVQSGTLHIGDNVVAGGADCKVRAMFDDGGRPVTEAGPSMPVQVLGWNDVPDAGDEFRVVEDERTAREIAANRQARERRLELASRGTMSLEDLSGAIAEGELSTLNLIIKGDVAGSVEALADAMAKLSLDEVKTRIIHKGVGAVNENDVSLAETSEAIIIAFNVRPEANARAAIEESGVDLRQYSVIYQAVDDIERAVKGLLAPEFVESVVGRAEVREVFRVPRVGFVFGCYVTDGNLRRNASARVVRDGVVVADDTISSLRRFKDDVGEVAAGYECGLGLAKFQDVKVGDELEVYERREVART